MISYSQRPIFWRIVMALVLYWGAGDFIAKPYLSNASALMAILCGGMMFVRYAPTAWRIIWHNEKSASGGHQAILGAAIVGFGFIYAGCFSLIWVHYGSPPGWLSTTTSSFGRTIMAVGFYLMATSPDARQDVSSYTSEFGRMAFVAFAIAVSFIAGAHFGSP